MYKGIKSRGLFPIRFKEKAYYYAREVLSIYPVGSCNMPIYVFNYTDYKLWKKYAEELRGDKAKKGSRNRINFFNALGCEVRFTATIALHCNNCFFIRKSYLCRLCSLVTESCVSLLPKSAHCCYQNLSTYRYRLQTELRVSVTVRMFLSVFFP